MTETTTATLNGTEVRLERPSALKASRALALLRALTKATPEVRDAWGKARREYEEANVVELDRTQARLRFPARVIFDENGDPLREPAHLGDEPNPRAGELVLSPSIIDHMTEEDWAKSNHKLRLPDTPSNEQLIAAVFDVALELAEDHVYRLLALFTMPNSDVKRAWRGGDFPQVLQACADDLIADSYADELLELAVVVGELVDRTFIQKARDLGDRMGNALRLFGIDRPTSPKPPTPTTTSEPTTSTSTPSSDGPEPSTSPSPTASPEPTAAAPAAPSSTSPGTSSAASSDASRTTPSETASPPSEPVVA